MDVWGHRALVCALVVVGCLVVVGSGAVAATDVSTDTGTDQHNESAAADLNAADEIQVTIDIHENRSATVEVDYRYKLNENDGTDVDWETLKDDIESDPEAYIEVENRSWQDTVDEAENATEREMELSNFTVETDESSTPVHLGHVTFEFEWSSFAYGELNRIEAGDALVGFTLVDQTRLTISWPETYNATEIQPAPTTREDTAAHWDGAETAFDDPRIELLENGAADEGNGEEEFVGISWQTGVVVGAVAVAFVAAVGAAGWLLRRETAREPAAGGAIGPVESTDGASATPPPELLSNEEQVLQLLEQRGGRLKQQQVVSELDWTEAKTSQVVTGLREDGEIEVFRIGRENVLVLADDE